MTLEREIELLKEKVLLLEKIRDLQEMIAKTDKEERQPIYVPYPVYPCYPSNPVTPWWQINGYWFTTGSVSKEP